MSLLGKKKDTHNAAGQIWAVQNGTAVGLEQMPDEVIRDGILGNGIIIIPTDGMVLSPVDGVVVTVAKSSHAFCIETPDGAEILIHIGADTVALNGEGFRPHVRQGSRVKAGKKLCTVDLDVLERNQCCPYTAVLLSNCDGFDYCSPHYGPTIAGKTVVMTYGKNTQKSGD